MPDKQLPHLVLGGRVKRPDGAEFEELDQVDIVGIYPNFATAREAWQAKAQATVDDAFTRYFVVHIHKLMDPSEE